MRVKDRKHGPFRQYTVSRGLAAAEKEASLMEAFAQAGDLIELSQAGFRLKDALSDLWDLRKECEDDWGDLLNILQAVLSQEEFERFSVDQCYAIRSVIADHLGAVAVDIDDIEDSIRLLRKAGFDPWKGISGTIGPQEQTRSKGEGLNSIETLP
ncbi:MAG: hypothetical protein L0229_23995 [Blastocatellia bacterium]|nr:hypothetical protein [Blastocatellia bacterium]